MPPVLQIILALAIVLGPLSAVHEFGHFWVARRLGVKVLVYSIGFGPGFIKWRDKRGTLYQITAIPLGGYVKMVDEREGDVAPEDLPFAFTQQAVWKRMAIVAAGPMINLLFAVLLFWVVFLRGTDSVRPLIDSVDAGSPAAVAGIQGGDMVTSVAGKPTADWDEVSYALIDHIGDTGALSLTVRGKGAVADRRLSLPLHNYLHDAGTDPLLVLGVHPYVPAPEPVIDEVVPDGPAAAQGLQAGDRIVLAGGKPVQSFTDVVSVISTQVDKPVALTVLRDGKTLNVMVTPKADKDSAGKPVGRIGILARSMPIPEELLVHTHLGVVPALGKAINETAFFSAFTLESMGKMLVGRISVNNLSGPIGIAKVASQSVSLGLEAVIRLMALLSISLGILNLLPVPVLDGGHLLYYSIEWLRGRPLSEQTQMFGLRIGVALLVSMMLLAVFNDLSRSFF